MNQRKNRRKKSNISRIIAWSVGTNKTSKNHTYTLKQFIQHIHLRKLPLSNRPFANKNRSGPNRLLNTYHKFFMPLLLNQPNISQIKNRYSLSYSHGNFFLFLHFDIESFHRTDSRCSVFGNGSRRHCRRTIFRRTFTSIHLITSDV